MIAGVALIFGLTVALAFGNPYIKTSRKWTPRLLKTCVIGLGAGMNLKVVADFGLRGVGYTFVVVFATLGLGYLLGRWLGIGRNTTVLVSVGTAICGGSAIAAIAPVIDSKNEELTLSLLTVFVLNAIALFLFPFLGHYFSLSEEQFGLWSALSIHDTSSVVGASMQFGPRALQIATTVKLTRTLWILPVAFICARFFAPKSKSKTQFPFFVFGFLAMAAFFTWVPELKSVGKSIAEFSRYGLVLTLFLIGFGVTRDTFSSLEARPLLLGLLLWLMTGGLTLLAILGLG